jgi:hypothetical protein
MKRKRANPNECFHCGKLVAADKPGAVRWDYKGSPMYCDHVCWEARREEQEKLRLWISAIHEGGHCLGVRLGGRRIKKATIVPSKTFDGCVTHDFDISKPYLDGGYRIEEYLLGHAAEVEFGYTHGIGHEYDYQQVREMLKAPIKHAKSEA